MSFSYSATSTFTILHARHITSKIATDLWQLSRFYELVPRWQIDNFAEEAALLLRDGFLESIEYGFKRGDKVIFALRYEARNGGLQTDDFPGRIPPDLDTTGASWYSYLRYSNQFLRLPAPERGAITQKLPVQRGDGPEPQTDFWSYWEEDRTYSSGGRSVTRKRLKSIL